MERKLNICPQTINQVNKQSLNSKTEVHSNPLCSVDSRGAGQYFAAYVAEENIYLQTHNQVNK